MGKATVKMPRQKQPFPCRILVRETAAEVSHANIVGRGETDSQGTAKSAKTSLGAADTCVCATFCRPNSPPRPPL